MEHGSVTHSGTNLKAPKHVRCSRLILSKLYDVQPVVPLLEGTGTELLAAEDELLELALDELELCVAELELGAVDLCSICL